MRRMIIVKPRWQGKSAPTLRIVHGVDVPLPPIAPGVRIRSRRRAVPWWIKEMYEHTT